MNDSSAQSSLIGQRAGSPRAKKSIAAALAVAALAAAGCQTRDAATAPASGDPQYAADIDALCNSIERANATGLASQEQQVVVAMWLGKTLHTAAAHDFLVKLAPLVGDAKAEALDAERARVGLATCPLAAVWRASESGSAQRLSAP